MSIEINSVAEELPELPTMSAKAMETRVTAAMKAIEGWAQLTPAEDLDTDSPEYTALAREMVTLVIEAADKARDGEAVTNDPRVVELVDAVDAIISNECKELFRLLDNGIGTETSNGKRWLRLRVAIANLEKKE